MYGTIVYQWKYISGQEVPLLPILTAYITPKYKLLWQEEGCY